MNERISGLLMSLKDKHGTLDPFYIIERENITLKYLSFPEEVLGRYMKVFERPTIFLNETLEMSNERYFVAAHELCHALEHSDISGYYTLNSQSKAKLEQEANRFAVALCSTLHLEEHDTLSSKDLKQLYGVPLNLSELFL